VAASGDEEDLTSSVRRQLAEKVDLRELAHLEQLAVFSDPHRIPGVRNDRVDVPRAGALPRDARTAAGHPLAPGERVAADGLRSRPDGRARPYRLVAKMSYTNIGFALTPREFALSTLRDIYSAALGHQVDATNLQRVLELATSSPAPAPHGAVPDAAVAVLRRCTASPNRANRVTDEFAALRPPG